MALTGGIGHLALAIAVFVVSHRLTAAGWLRTPLERRIGRTGFVAAYSVLSLVLFGWIIAAYQAAPFVALWEQSRWMRFVPLLAMLPASQLIAIGLTTPNPFSIGPGARGFDPARSGILRLTRHPVLWGLALWAAAHCVPNGDVAALLLFLPLLALALAGPRLLDARRRQTLGETEWRRLSAFPPGSLWRETGWKRPLLGLALYAALMAAHLPVIGASPHP